jgi:hypothetical protein
MNIILFPGVPTALIEQYFDFNHISYLKLDPFNANIDGGRYTFDFDCLKQSNVLFIISSELFAELISWEVSRQQVIDFCSQGNRLWIINRFDVFTMFVGKYEANLKFNALVPPKSVTFFFDAVPTSNYVKSKLESFHYKVFPYSSLMNLSRISNAKVIKTNCTNDYMLTMGHAKIHKEHIWNQLQQRPDLLAKGKVVYHSHDRPENYGATHPWLGQKHPLAGWNEGHTSMDLYLDTWVELLPETLYQNGYYYTEKTNKPIVSKTPFLIVSTPGYLKYLHSLGFQTFNTLIDERYDQIDSVNDRVTCVLNQLEDIIKNGSENFYHACQPILDHNHNKLAEITGRWVYDTDLFFEETLNEIGIK